MIKMLRYSDAELVMLRSQNSICYPCLAIRGWSTDIRGPVCTYSLMANTILYNTVWGTIPTFSNATQPTIKFLCYKFLCHWPRKSLTLPSQTVFYALARNTCSSHMLMMTMLHRDNIIVMQQGWMQRHLVEHMWIFGSSSHLLPGGAIPGPRWGQGPPRAATIQHWTLFLTKYISALQIGWIFEQSPEEASITKVAVHL